MKKKSAHITRKTNAARSGVRKRRDIEKPGVEKKKMYSCGNQMLGNRGIPKMPYDDDGKGREGFFPVPIQNPTQTYF